MSRRKKWRVDIEQSPTTGLWSWNLYRGYGLLDHGYHVATRDQCLVEAKEAKDRLIAWDEREQESYEL